MPLVAIKDIQEIDKKVDNYQKIPRRRLVNLRGIFAISSFCYYRYQKWLEPSKQ